MSDNSMSELQKTLQQKAQENNAAVNKIVQNEFRRLAKSLKQRSSAELSTTATAIDKGFKLIRDQVRDEIQDVNKFMWLKWIIPLIVGLGLTLGIALGSWGVLKYLANQIQDEKAELQLIKEAKADLSSLNIEVQKHEDADYLILPKGKKQPSIYEHPNSPGQWVIQIPK